MFENCLIPGFIIHNCCPMGKRGLNGLKKKIDIYTENPYKYIRRHS